MRKAMEAEFPPLPQGKDPLKAAVSVARRAAPSAVVRRRQTPPAISTPVPVASNKSKMQPSDRVALEKAKASVKSTPGCPQSQDNVLASALSVLSK